MSCGDAPACVEPCGGPEIALQVARVMAPLLGWSRTKNAHNSNATPKNGIETFREPAFDYRPTGQ